MAVSSFTIEPEHGSSNNIYSNELIFDSHCDFKYF